MFSYKFEFFSFSFFKVYRFNCLSVHIRRIFVVQLFHLLDIYVKPKEKVDWCSTGVSLNYCFSSFREPIFIACFLDESGVFEFSKATSHSE